MALNPLDLDEKSTGDLRAMLTHYRQVKRISDRYDLKRCTDALKAIRSALKRRQQGLTSEPE